MVTFILTTSKSEHNSEFAIGANLSSCKALASADRIASSAVVVLVFLLNPSCSLFYFSYSLQDKSKICLFVLFIIACLPSRRRRETIRAIIISFGEFSRLKDFFKNCGPYCIRVPS